MKRILLVFLALVSAFVLGISVYRYVPFAHNRSLDRSFVVRAAQRSGFPLTLHPIPRAVPALHFYDGDGHPKTLTNFRGRIVLLNVWATWCPPCREEMPSLDRLQAKLGGPEFEVVALSIDINGVPAVQRFFQEVGIKALKTYSDPTTDTTARLSIPGIPGTLLIDRDGRELGRAIGSAKWDGPEATALIRQAIGHVGVTSAPAQPPAGGRHD